MIAGVDCGSNKSRSFSICSCNCKEISSCRAVSTFFFRRILAPYTHDIGLSTDGNKTVDVLTDWHQHLSCHVSALLRARSLILNMNPCGTFFYEEFRQLHNSGQTTMSSISIGDNGSEIIDVRQFVAIGFRGCCHTLFALLPVVEKLCHEQMLDFVWDRCLG